MPSGVSLDVEFSLPKIRGNYKQAGDENVVDMVFVTKSLDLFHPVASNETERKPSVVAEATVPVSVLADSAPVDDRGSVSSVSSRQPSVSSQTAAGRHAKPSVPAMKVGMLKKDGHGLISSWKMRHFVLLKGRLTYYEKASFVEPYGIGEKGFSELKNMKVSQIANIPQFRMLLEHNTDSKVKSYIIEAANQKELQDWILAIDEHIEYATNNLNVKL